MRLVISIGMISIGAPRLRRLRHHTCTGRRQRFRNLDPAAGGRGERRQHARALGRRDHQVDPKNDRTCFEVLARDLYADSRPNRHDNRRRPLHRLQQGFYDPAVYTAWPPT